MRAYRACGDRLDAAEAYFIGIRGKKRGWTCDYKGIDIARMIVSPDTVDLVGTLATYATVCLGILRPPESAINKNREWVAALLKKASAQ